MSGEMDFPFMKRSTKFDKLFSDGAVFRLACAVSGIALFMFMRTIFSAFGGIRLDEFQSLYYMVGNHDMNAGIVNLILGGSAAAVLSFMGTSLFGMYAAAKKSDTAKAEKHLKYVKIALVIMLLFTIVAVVVSFASVGTIEYYYRALSKQYKEIESYANDLFQKTVFIGTTVFFAEIAAIKFFWDMGRVINGGHEEHKIHIFEIVVMAAFSMETAAIAMDNAVRLFRFDYSASGQNPVKWAMLFVTFFMMLSAYLAIVFFLETIFLHLFVYDAEDEYFDFDESFFFEPEEEFESRVFDKTPLHYGSAENYSLSIEIPHTEYPESEVMSDG